VTINRKVTARRARHDLFTNCDNSLPIHARPIRAEMGTNAALKSTAIGGLHAGVRCAMNQRKELERLCRYITRPVIANERLTRSAAGQGAFAKTAVRY